MYKWPSDGIEHQPQDVVGGNVQNGETYCISAYRQHLEGALIHMGSGTEDLTLIIDGKRYTRRSAPGLSASPEKSDLEALRDHEDAVKGAMVRIGLAFIAAVLEALKEAEDTTRKADVT